MAIMIRGGVKNICTGAECSLVAQRAVRSPHAVTRPRGTNHHSTQASDINPSLREAERGVGSGFLRLGQGVMYAMFEQSLEQAYRVSWFWCLIRPRITCTAAAVGGVFSNLYLRFLFGCLVPPGYLHSPEITWGSWVFSRISSERLCLSSLQHSVPATFVHRRSIRPSNEIYTSRCPTFVPST